MLSIAPAIITAVTTIILALIARKKEKKELRKKDMLKDNTYYIDKFKNGTN